MPRHLSHRGLQAFRYTVLTGSVSQAADALARTQPAVSRLLKELEEEIGFRLFDRIKGRLRATPEARLLFEETQRSFIGLERIASVAGEIRQGRHSSLSVACMPAMAPILPSILQEFGRRHPECRVSVHCLHSESVVPMVLTGSCALGFASTLVGIPGLVAERSFSIPCRCILPAGHPLALRGSLHPEDLRGETLVSFFSATQIGAQVNAILDRNGIEIHTRIETHLSGIISDLVLEGVGIGIVDALAAANHARRGGLSRPFVPKVTFEMRLIRQAGVSLASVAESFLQASDQVFTCHSDIAMQNSANLG
ncbi:LysR substrate-binding domain-containing protein [Roseomonas sp. E05]|uniref:LysR substrate-binding domain-containing protein n=1 Tax=Roseomonas sp. E05 TaxID=3046310 RepID=UPI0024B9DEA5|nr:LysR substrate-binding domain-containing protein [Roseomonas sp. E05]MDJ0391272.1 LysR substrate-binding domain-containing protein [Roseomonas sp. E05]